MLKIFDDFKHCLSGILAKLSNGSRTLMKCPGCISLSRMMILEGKIVCTKGIMTDVQGMEIDGGWAGLLWLKILADIPLPGS